MDNIKRFLNAFNYILNTNDIKTHKEFKTLYNLMDGSENNNNSIDTITATQHAEATKQVKNYYNNLFTLDILHDKLFNIFKSYKIGVLWLYYNNDRIRYEVLKI